MWLSLAPSNAADTSQLLGSLSQLGPQSQGRARVEVTTSRPGAGASFRLGEEITYFVTAAVATRAKPAPSAAGLGSRPQLVWSYVTVLIRP